MRFWLRRSLLPVVLLTAALGCGGSNPDINSVSVTPSTIALSGITESVTFAVSCNVLHFGGSISSVTATVEGQSIDVTLSKSGGVIGDEQWSGTFQETLFNGFSAGVYQIDVTATDSNGVTVTDKAAATVTITN
jgi:hypothetical protein